MAEEDKAEIDLESNLKTSPKDNILSDSEKRKSQTIDIDNDYIRQIAREDYDNPSLKKYILPFLVVGFITLVWVIVLAEEVGEWISRFF